ncbi:MAG: hypothetical protein J5746_04885 [Victivallales bacterium]|nr:hypothetical protein [Victivallales bacterium]
MGQTYIEELNWLREELGKIKGQVGNQNEQQKAWGEALAKQRKRNKELKASLADRDKDLANAQAEARNEAGRLKKAEDDAVRDEATKEEELDVLRRDKSQLMHQLDEAKRKIAPILSEITALNLEIAQLQQDNEVKRNSVNDSEALPKEVKNLQGRLERAMRLKPGLLQKIRFVEELFTELGESGSSERARLFAEYKRLAKELETMKYEQ